MVDLDRCVACGSSLARCLAVTQTGTQGDVSRGAAAEHRMRRAEMDRESIWGVA